MAEHIEETNQPHPREAFGHPVTKLVMHEVSNHSPGFEESPPPAYSGQAMESQVVPAELPPWDPDKVPRAGLAERIIQRFTQQKEAK